LDRPGAFRLFHPVARQSRRAGRHRGRSLRGAVAFSPPHPCRSHDMKIRRRTLLSAAPGLALGGALAGISPALAAPAALTGDTVLKPRSGSAPRIVICGGGWGGLTAARYLKAELPDAEVILLERNPFFWSA